VNKSILTIQKQLAKVLFGWSFIKHHHERTTGGLAIWRGDEYMLSFLFVIGLQFQLDEQRRAIK
jgi:hypothetical protein